jgi:hypothetical protein
METQEMAQMMELLLAMREGRKEKSSYLSGFRTEKETSRYTTREK